MQSDINKEGQIEPVLYRPNSLSVKTLTRIRKEQGLSGMIPPPINWKNVSSGPPAPMDGLIPLTLMYRILFCLSPEGHLWAYTLDENKAPKNVYYRNEFEIRQALTDFFQEKQDRNMPPYEQLSPVYKKYGCYFQYSSIDNQPLHTKAYITTIDAYLSLTRSRYSSMDRLAYRINRYMKGERLTFPSITPSVHDRESWTLPQVLSPEDITHAIFCKEDTFHDAKNARCDITNLYNTKLMNLYLKTGKQDDPSYENMLTSYTALKNSQWNKENITESMDITKIDPKTLRIIASMKNIRYERTADNTNKDTFDFIRLHMGLCTKNAVPDRNEHIKTHGREFASMALSRIADSKKFKTSGFPLGFLKLEKNVHYRTGRT